MNYNYPQKRNSRRTLWNDVKEITKIVGINRREAIVHYLAGELDLDREVALTKGFSGRNMIAIERDKNIVRSLRTRGVLTIHGDFFRVAKAIKPSHHVDVVFGDLTCGLEPRGLNDFFTALWLNSAFAQCVVALNLQHGRDKRGNDYRNAFLGVREKFLAISRDVTAHRGEMAYFMYLARGQQLARLSQNASFIHYMDSLILEIDRVGPRYRSYMSVSGQKFDSVTFYNAIKRVTMDDWAELSKAELATRRKIAAVMAHRTRRLPP